MPDMSGASVIVAGGAGGIGSATVRRFVAAGADVTIFDRADGSQLAEELSGSGSTVTAVQTDITDLERVSRDVDEVVARLGRIDALVNAVGWNEHSFFRDQTPDFWRRVIDINLMGQIYTSRAVVDHMVAQKSGSIVLLASDAGRVGTNGETIYSAAKGGVIAFTKSLSRELTRFGVRVNCVSPGVTHTPMYEATVGHQPEIVAKMVAGIPMRRVAQPDEQAEAIYFLSSPAASYITGQTLSVNGGLNML